MARTIPCSTPTAQTTTAVMTAMKNSLRRRCAMRRKPAMSTRPIPMRKTIAPRTARGISVSTLVKNSATRSTIADIVRLASCVRPFCSSRISVLVGLPLTTKVPDSPATKLAPDSPRMSRFTSTLWPCFIAKLREVAALWAMMRMQQEKAIAAQVAKLSRSIPSGRPIVGKPPFTDPTTATPCEEASVAADTMIISATATTAPGIRGT